MLILLTKPAVLVALCAVSYAAATLAMKTVAHAPNVPTLCAVVLCLAIAVAEEVVLMRNMAMGLTYIAILCAETVLVLICATALGEVPTLRQVLGAMLVLGGAVLVTA